MERKTGYDPHMPHPKHEATLSAGGSGGVEIAPPGGQESGAHVVALATRPRIQELEEVLTEYHGQRLVIFIKGYPDPDAIASSLAHQYICRGHGVDADIMYFEEPSHRENKALVKQLQIPMTKWSPDVDLRLYAGFCTVDTQSPKMPIRLPKELKLVSLVDHHKSIGKIDGQFVDVREDAGSVASIYAEYLAEGTVKLDPDHPVTSTMATALMYGIRTDTDNFLLARPIDYHASAFLAPFVDRDKLEVFSKQSISAKSMDILQTAMDRKVIEGTYLIAGVGFVRDEDRDGISAAADYLLRREGVDTVLLYGVVGGAEIDGSLRTLSHAVDPDKWMKELFGVDASGRFYGGGRQNKGGFQIPLGIFGRCTDRALLWRTVQRTVEDVFFEKIGAKPKDRDNKGG